MLNSPQYKKEVADMKGYVPHARQVDLATTTKRELLSKILESTGLKLRLKAVYLPMGKELHNQSDDIIIKDIMNILEISQDNVRNNERMEDRVSRITNRKSRLTKGKMKPPTGEYYLNAVTGTNTNVTRPISRQKLKPEDRTRLKDMCTICKSKIGKSPVSTEALREVCLKEQHKRNQTPFKPNIRRSSPSASRRNLRQSSPRTSKHTSKHSIKAISNPYRNEQNFMIRRTQECQNPDEPEVNYYDELYEEIHHRKMILDGFEDIHHNFPNLTETGKMKDNYEESGTDTETSDSEPEQHEDHESNEETDPDSPSD